jgi:putative ATP-binding cassette transporter
VNYPDAAQSRSVEEIAKVLDKVELGHLTTHLDEDRPWDQILSGGEKQRLAFARILLHRPDIVVLDEATAALDSPSQNRVMELLSQELKDATVISIGHRAELADFHHRKIILLCGRDGASLVGDVHPARSASAQDSSAAEQERLCCGLSDGQESVRADDTHSAIARRAA